MRELFGISNIEIASTVACVTVLTNPVASGRAFSAKWCANCGNWRLLCVIFVLIVLALSII